VDTGLVERGSPCKSSGSRNRCDQWPTGADPDLILFLVYSRLSTVNYSVGQWHRSYITSAVVGWPGGVDVVLVGADRFWLEMLECIP
jgi:hypothetical protein